MCMWFSKSVIILNTSYSKLDLISYIFDADSVFLNLPELPVFMCMLVLTVTGQRK